MGLNIGIDVEAQVEGYGEPGRNPPTDQEELEKLFFDYMAKRLPNGGWCGGWAKYIKPSGRYEFNVRLTEYGAQLQEAGYSQNQVYEAILGFILEQFSAYHGIDMQLSWSG